MNRFSDQKLAQQMLRIRDQGYSLTLFFRRNARRYCVILIYFGLALAGFALFRLWMPFYLMLGILVGCISRDIGIVRVGRRQWPFNLKVTDWDKVQKLADGKPLT